MGVLPHKTRARPSELTLDLQGGGVARQIYETKLVSYIVTQDLLP